MSLWYQLPIFMNSNSGSFCHWQKIEKGFRGEKALFLLLTIVS